MRLRRVLSGNKQQVGSQSEQLCRLHCEVFTTCIPRSRSQGRPGHQIEVSLLGEESKSEFFQNLPMLCCRQVMKERQDGVKFHREPSIGRSDEYTPPGDSPQL